MDIEKIAKTVTRKDFLEEAAKDSMGKFNCEKDCPNGFGLEKIYNNCKPYKDCKKCWMNAIKNIKFKGENEMEKEYSIREVFEFEEGTQFEVFYKDGSKNQFKAEVFKEFKDSEKILIWSEDKKEINIKSRILNAKFKLVKKDKEVLFSDLLNSNQKCIVKHNLIKDLECFKEYKYLYEVLKEITTFFQNEGTCKIIKDGTWFILEEQKEED